MAIFTYGEGDLSTPLNYARWRLDDTDKEIRSDSNGNPAPYLWDEDYELLFEKFGVREGMALAAGKIAIIISKDLTKFSEAGGVTVAYENQKYYEKLPGIIRAEQGFDGLGDASLAVSGQIRAGTEDYCQEHGHAYSSGYQGPPTSLVRRNRRRVFPLQTFPRRHSY